MTEMNRVVEYGEGQRYLGETITAPEPTEDDDQEPKSIRQGKGVMYFSETEFYFGDWFQDKSNGLGVYSYANGERYEGVMVDGQPHGKGKLFHLNGSVYTGQFVEGQQTGWAELSHPAPSKHSYWGQFVNGHRHGSGC